MNTKPVVTIGRYQDRIPSDRPIQELIDIHGKGNVYIDGVTVASLEAAEAVTAIEKVEQSQADDADDKAIAGARAKVRDMVDAAATRVNNKELHSEDAAVELCADLEENHGDIVTLLSDEVNQPNMLVAIQCRMRDLVSPDSTETQANAIASGAAPQEGS